MYCRCVSVIILSASCSKIIEKLVLKVSHYRPSCRPPSEEKREHGHEAVVF